MTVTVTVVGVGDAGCSGFWSAAAIGVAHTAPTATAAALTANAGVMCFSPIRMVATLRFDIRICLCCFWFLAAASCIRPNATRREPVSAVSREQAVRSASGPAVITRISAVAAA